MMPQPSLFLGLLQSLDADPAQRGRQFEHFVRWFLTTDPEWSTQVDQVWLWDEWPGRWGPDWARNKMSESRKDLLEGLPGWVLQVRKSNSDLSETGHE